MAALGLALAGAGGVSAGSASADAPPVGACGQVDGTRLGALLAARGFAPPERFKALVLDLGTDASPACAAYDLGGSSRDRDGWWPASTVKLYAAVAALEVAGREGFSPKAKLSFAYEDGAVEETLAGLVERALGPSNNLAYDRLVELVGFDELHRRFFAPRNGFTDTVLLRSYAGRIRDPKTRNGQNRHSPPITLAEREQSRTLPERAGKLERSCPEQGNCTTLAELAETMRRVMLHERLPRKERFALDDAALALLRRVLSSERPRGMNVVLGLREGYGQTPIRTFHKPGFALDWMSDVVFVQESQSGRRYVVALAGYPGRESLDAASRAVGALLASGALSSAAPVPEVAAAQAAAPEPARAAAP